MTQANETFKRDNPKWDKLAFILQQMRVGQYRDTATQKHHFRESTCLLVRWRSGVSVFLRFSHAIAFGSEKTNASRDSGNENDHRVTSASRDSGDEIGICSSCVPWCYRSSRAKKRAPCVSSTPRTCVIINGMLHVVNLGQRNARNAFSTATVSSCANISGISSYGETSFCFRRRMKSLTSCAWALT